MQASESFFGVKNVKKGVFSQPDVSRLSEVAEIGAEYSLPKETKLWKKVFQFTEDQPFRLSRC